MSQPLDSRRVRRTPSLVLALLAVVAALRCTAAGTAGPLAGATLALGTWGGDTAGVIVDDTLMHVHVGCTDGDFPGPVPLGLSRRVDVVGSYQLHAYPVPVGPPMPARLTGTLVGATLTFTVTVDDTVAGTTVTKGPVKVSYKTEPRMGPCPICRKPAERMIHR